MHSGCQLSGLVFPREIITHNSFPYNYILKEDTEELSEPVTMELEIIKIFLELGMHLILFL